MFNEAIIVRRLRLAFLGGVAVAGSLSVVPAIAQEVQQGERVEVTGSNIRRVQSETASPVQTVTREEIDRSGKTSVAELLQTLSVDNAGSVPTTFGAGFASGAAGISLRGLGTASTLVLLNGRRVAPYALADDGQKVFSDLNLIPLEAVERVEILKDGGSSIYGSDAIAGVVNIILRKDYVGTSIRGSVGQSPNYGDGRDTKVAITTGFGNLDSDKYNVLFNFEYGKKEPIANSNRSDRKWVGKSDLRNYGYDADSSGGANGGNGAIISGGGAATGSIIGNVRDPASLNYFSRDNLSAGTGFTRTFPGARCSNLTDHPQGDPGGGCLIDAAQQYGQISPKSENFNFFTRGSLQINDSTTAYIEGNYYDDRSRSQGTPSSISSSEGYPGGPVSNAAVALGATHPDNPYFGTVARLRYLASDVGPRQSAVDSQFTRFLVGLRGTAFGWDYDTGALYSRSKVSNVRSNYLQRDVEFALLNPTAANVAAARAGSAAYAALPAGTVWRIGENSGLNSSALYQALSPKISNDAKSVTTQLDAKASHEFGQLPGGPFAVAVGTEVRHESIELQPTTGTDRGNVVGLGYSAYDGGRTITAVYAEVVAPVLKTLELSAAARGDHYSDVGNSFTPKGGIKWTPIPQLAIRGTFQKGFRAPSPAENGVGGLAAFSSATDPARCSLGIAAGCSASSVAIITSPNRDLVPERSKTYTGGFVLDPTRDTSIALDYFKIVRKNEINQETTDSAIAAGHVARDASTALVAFPGDPGIITAVLANYINSPGTTVRGADLDARQDFNLGGGYGKISLDLKWTHIFAFVRTDPDGSVRDFAGTHGNCDTTNCIGTPMDRVNLGVTYTVGPVAVSTIANYRSALKNTLFRNDPAGCAFVYADGSDAPTNCRIGSFTTWDLSARWQATRNWQVFGSVQNLFNKIPPLDPTTYGEVSFNPLDFQGAVGRFVSVGARYKF